MRLGRGIAGAVLLRSFAIQGSWNYKTLLGSGFAFALLPALRRLYAGRPQELAAAVERHSRLFNSHPYMAPMALGAVLRLESDGQEPAVIERFKTAVRGSLGMVGDRLIWAGWRPVCLLFGIALVLAGAHPVVGAVAFLVIYNAGHVFVRLWSYRVGLREGLAVAERFRRTPISTIHRVLAHVGAFLAGLVLPLAVYGRATDAAAPDIEVPWPWVSAGALGVLAALRAGPGARRVAALALTGFALLGLGLGAFA